MNVDIYCKLVRETSAAYLINDGTEEVWVPKSQCEWEPEGNSPQFTALERNHGTMSMPEWLAKDKGLI